MLGLPVTALIRVIVRPFAFYEMFRSSWWTESFVEANLWYFLSSKGGRGCMGDGQVMFTMCFVTVVKCFHTDMV